MFGGKNVNLRKIISLYLFLFLSIQITLIPFVSAQNYNNEGIFSQIAEQYLRSFSKPTLTQEEIKSTINPNNPTQIDDTAVKNLLNKKLAKLKSHQIILSLFEQNNKSKNPQLQYSPTPCVVSDMLWQDLELFCGQHKPSVYLLSKLARTKTATGKTMLGKMLAEPTTDIKELLRRQNIVKQLIENEKIFNALEHFMNEYAEIESDLIAFWDEKTFNHLFSSDFYFPPYPLNHLPKTILQYIIPKDTQHRLNQNSTALEGLTLLNNSLTIRSLALEVNNPQVHWQHTKYNFQDLMEQMSVISGKNDNSWYKKEWDEASVFGKMWYGIKTFWTFDKIGYHAAQIPLSFFTILKIAGNEKTKWETLKIAHKKLKHAATAINSLIKIQKVVNSNKLLDEQMICFDNVDYLFEEISSNSLEFDNLLSTLTSPSFAKDKNFILFSRGKILSAAYLMAKTQNRLIDILQVLGQVDTYLSIAKLYKEHQNKSAKFCFANYIQQDKPYICQKDFWTPFINPETVITNSIELGSDDSAKSAIVSGPNAGGKSTILKAIITNLLLAQTIGICAANEVTLTPFAYLDTYLNITDDIASGNSLFKSEVLRVKYLIETIKALKENEFSFVVMDEIFSGTNPIEGEAAGYAIGKHLSTLPNSITMIASHYPKLTNLEQDTDGWFKNYKVSVNKQKDNSLNYPFKLEEGKTNQTIAIDILKTEDFDPQIINDAYSAIGVGSE